MSRQVLFSKLRGALSERGLAQADIANALNITVSCVNHRFTGTTEWRLKEMYTVMKLIDEPDEKLHLYFQNSIK